MGPSTRTPLTVALESGHLARQGSQVSGQLLDPEEGIGMTWDTRRWAVQRVPGSPMSLRGAGPGKLGALPRTPHPGAGEGGEQGGSEWLGLTCFELLLLLLQLALQGKHLVVQATGCGGGRSAPRAAPTPTSAPKALGSFHTCS